MSLIETYQSRKSLFAQKLITKGVTASATDGLTTLINKIDDIGDTFSGLLLNGDKSIAQRGDTVTLSMMLLDDAELQYNTDITLYENTFEHTYSSATTINEDIGEDYEIVIHSGSFRICGSGVTPSNGAVIQLNNNYLIGYNNGNYMISPRTTGTNRYRIKNGVLSYGNTSFDLSSYDIDFSNLKECIKAGKVTVYTSTVVNTGSDGVATYDYTCTGAGEKTFFAKSGIFQSETFVILDAIAKDIGTSTNHNDNLWTVTRGTLNRGTEETELTLNTGQTNVMAYFNLTNTDSFIIEFDTIFDCTSNLAQLRDSNWNVLSYVRGSNYSKDTYYHIKIQVLNGQVTIWVGDTMQTPISINDVYMFSFYITSSDNYLKFKNFEYYPI